VSDVTSVLLVGVGGQGTILAGDVLAKVAAASGLDVKLSEVHGMSQRGGSVDTMVRFGDKVHSPVVSPGEVDHLVAFEVIEAARWLPYLKPGGRGDLREDVTCEDRPLTTHAYQQHRGRRHERSPASHASAPTAIAR
jgi:indolepyruvate ferredoxin oxidoreductase, beta subunit